MITEKQYAINILREWLKPGDTVYCISRHRSASNMRQTIQVIGFNRNGNEKLPYYYGRNIATAIGARYDENNEGVIVNGCGFDRGADIVGRLSAVLFPDLPCPEQALNMIWL